MAVYGTDTRTDSGTGNEPATTAGQKASDLEAAGVRDAAVLETGGAREAAVLQTAGQREAAARATAGQRRINLIWEVTQAVIAVLVTVGTLVISAWLVLGKHESSATAFLLLSNAFFMIVTTYFQRTNHTKIGGISERGER